MLLYMHYNLLVGRALRYQLSLFFNLDSSVSMPGGGEGMEGGREEPFAKYTV